ncbi:MAG: hypothetical protein J7501_16820 [Bdellovibrio sp.]|nr:hypothetical protein [Bdellovibrio sp.]
MFAKVAIASLMMAVSSFAFAYPTLGDKVEWTGAEVKLDGTSTPITVTKEVTKWDDATMMWTVKVDMTKGDQTSTKEVMTKCLWSPESWTMMKENCVMEGGTLESVTVDAGTYDSCRMNTVSDDGSVTKKWWGDVPFGLIKKEMTDVKAGTKTTVGIKTITPGPTPAPGQ